MTIRRAATAMPLLALAGCLPEASLDTDIQKASYAIGYDMGSSLAEIAEHVDMRALTQGMTDALGGMDAALTEHEIQDAMDAFGAIVHTATEDEAARELEAGRAFLDENSGREGVVTTESGLQYIVLREGDGAFPLPGQDVRLHYRGTLPDGTEFDTSYDGQPATFGVDGVIAGFGEAIQLMKVGGHLRAFIPSGLAYGASGMPPTIGPNQVLIFEIELLGIE